MEIIRNSCGPGQLAPAGIWGLLYIMTEEQVNCVEMPSGLWLCSTIFFYVISAGWERMLNLREGGSKEGRLEGERERERDEEGEKAESEAAAEC
jgi:hypothetical protein